MKRTSLPIILKNNFTSISKDYKRLAEEKDGCRRCGVYNDYERIVHSQGNAKNPTFVFVGEAPGADEVDAVQPFVGKAGQRLRSALRKHKDVINRQTALLTNVMSCRPLNNKFPKGSEPKTCCSNWLMREIEILQPSILVLLGSQPLKYVAGMQGITKKRGKWFCIDSLAVSVMPTFHPSYVIRCENGMNKEVAEQFENDIELVASEGRRLLQV